MKKVLTLLTLMAIVAVVLQASAQENQRPAVPEKMLRMLQSKHVISSRRVYLVQMRDAAVADYTGDVAGLPATASVTGRKMHAKSSNVKQYVAFLEGRHHDVIRRVGGRPVYHFYYGINGVAASMTKAQAAALAALPGVLSVQPDAVYHLQTDRSPDFLGLTDAGGPWERDYTGEGVIVGVIDTGIWPEHPSFADNGSYGAPPPSFAGLGCDFGNTVFNPNDVPFACNNKILAAKSYGLGLHGGTGDGLAAGSYHSARDEDGHGSHTASTAAGNADVMASISGTELGMVSGIAPRARLSIYKACWHTSPTESECLMSDLVAAIDRAIADGVDVINLSIGSNVSSLLDPIDLALLNAVRTGIFVVTAAGNNGPDLDTIGGTPASVPWVTTVAASSHDRTFQGTVWLENGSSFFGASITDGAGRHRLVDAATLGNALCNPDLPFSASVASQLVLCMRGEIARLAKSLAVWQAAGVGMILYNASDDETQITDNHYVPTIHINNTDGLAVKAYIANAGAEAMASLQGGAAISTQGSVIADFSSRGIALAVPDIIKPDVTAPGVNILAANTPTGLLGASGELFQVISGTSMSTPHVAGMFALLKQAHPGWSPAIAKSALMTTARQDVFKEDGVTAADPFDYGAGHIAPGGDWHSGSIVQPGLVYDAGIQEYFGFLCGNTQAVNPAVCQGLAANTVPFDASDLNLPSIGISQLIANQTVVRTVTSVVQDAGVTTFQVSVEPPSGFDVRVSPQTLSLEPGQTATYDVTIINNGQAVSDTWAFGALTWREAMGRYTVRSPMAVRAVYIEVPKELSATGTTGTQSFDVTFGYAGDYHQTVHGLVAAAEDPAVVLDDPGNDIVAAITCWFTSGGSLMTPGDPACGLTLHLVEVAAGATLIRFSLFDAFTDGSDDLDVLVWHPSGTLAGGSGSTTSAEQVDVPFPEMGTYSVLVHGWQTAGPDANYTLFSWEVGPDAGNMTVSGAPTTVSVGDSASLSVDWFDLETGKKYLGVVSHHNGPVTQGSPDVLGLTVINVDTN